MPAQAHDCNIQKRPLTYSPTNWLHDLIRLTEPMIPCLTLNDSPELPLDHNDTLATKSRKGPPPYVCLATVHIYIYCDRPLPYVIIMCQRSTYHNSVGPWVSSLGTPPPSKYSAHSIPAFVWGHLQQNVYNISPHARAHTALPMGHLKRRNGWSQATCLLLPTGDCAHRYF